jgi:hypothetical protein
MTDPVSVPDLLARIAQWHQEEWCVGNDSAADLLEACRVALGAQQARLDQQAIVLGEFFARQEDDCACNGGEQGDGLCYVPHENTCPVHLRQTAPSPRGSAAPPSAQRSRNDAG